MNSSMDFNELGAQVLEELKAGKPLFGKDGALAPLLENIINAALEGEMDAHLSEESRQALEDVQQQKQAYQKENDCALYSDAPTSFVDLRPGQFAIMYPEDPHAPVIGEGKIRKLIAKVKI